MSSIEDDLPDQPDECRVPNCPVCGIDSEWADDDATDD